MSKIDFQQDFLDLVGELGNITFGNASTALNMMLGVDINISAPKVEIISKDELLESFPDPYVFVEVEYTEGLEGHNVLLLDPKDAAIISHLMMGGDGKPDSLELGELELSAVQEAMNQMMGTAATSMSSFLNKTIDINPPNIAHNVIIDNNSIENFFIDRFVVKVSFDLTIGDLTKSNLMQIFNLPFTKQLASELLGL